MRKYIIMWVLVVTPVHAQNGKWNVDPANDGQAQWQARIDACFRNAPQTSACFRNAPQTSARDAWLDKCLRDTR
jgi:hypothetical protein